MSRLRVAEAPTLRSGNVTGLGPTTAWRRDAAAGLERQSTAPAIADSACVEASSRARAGERVLAYLEAVERA